MATTTYELTTVTGKQVMRRSKKQGAPEKPDEIKNLYTVVIHMTEQNYFSFIEAQKKSHMKKSAFGRIVLFLGLESYLNQIIG